MKPSHFQLLLIAAGIVASAMLGVFMYREAFPEYRIYQDDYIALEQFRSSYTNEPPPPFKVGVKQIVIENENKGPAEIDRCISCHVALQIEDFSPTKIAKDINGNVIFDELGFPEKIENPSYIWNKLDEKIKELRDPSHSSPARLKLADQYEALKKAKVGEYEYHVEKVLQMHPLIGRETRPFEFHPIEEYGCTSCHGGNGRGLVTDRAHGPVFDGQYEPELQGYKPQFLEIDPKNDPLFARVFNEKPGHRLLFQTNPIYVGTLIQAKCMQCHQGSQGALQGASDSAKRVFMRNEQEFAAIENALEQEKQAVISMVEIKLSLEKEGYQPTLDRLEKAKGDVTLLPRQRDRLASQAKFLKDTRPEQALQEVDRSLLTSFGSNRLVNEFAKTFNPSKSSESLENFIQSNEGKEQAKGSIFEKMETLQLNKALVRHVKDLRKSFQTAVDDSQNMDKIQTDIDRLTKDFHRGQNLFLSQACYACHRISNFARGGVGPELTLAGQTYPWFLKQKISYPQFDLHNSTMPNYRMDHDELERLVTFLLAQNGPGKNQSDLSYKTKVLEWEAGKKQPWEEPASPSQIHDIRYGMTVFATEGCAACHRLQGYESNVGFTIEKNEHSFDDLYKEKQWFRELFPEFIRGSDIVRTLEMNANEIHDRIAENVRENSILEDIEREYPGTIESFYTNFKFASRAHNHRYKERVKLEKDEEKRLQAAKELKEWNSLVRRVLMMYVQEYGLGRMICPRPNWSGVYRSDQWLMEHFRNPTAHVPRSIMPVFPFDDTKFYALTYMLDVLAQKNNHQDRLIWKHAGFNPELAFQKYCSQCHGEYLFGNGPISEWIYPIPKNLRRADFLRNLTKENAIQSIMHGVKGTPMPPWGELGNDKSIENKEPILTQREIELLVDWLFSSLPGGTVIRDSQDIPKWQYTPEDVIRELKNEGGELKGLENGPLSLLNPPNAMNFLVSLKPVVVAANLSKGADQVDDVFDIVKEPIGDVEQTSFYIKKKYYTPENLAEGKRLFYENCAPCHGKEADGSGLRAEAMHDAKPRMLINLDWLQTRDDLRLLRSIKYGVPGTSMTPWGDQTSSLQRLQLVMFIRSLTQPQEERSSLTRVIYRVFDDAEFLVERARIDEYSKLAELQEEYQRVRREREEFDRKVLQGEMFAKDALSIYQKELDLGAKLQKSEKADQLYQELRKKIKLEKDLYLASGFGFMELGFHSSSMEYYLEMIELNENRYQFKDHQLVWNPSFNEQRFEQLKNQILALLKEREEAEERQKMILEGRVYSSELAKALSNVGARLNSIQNQRSRFLNNLTEALSLRREQNALLNVINESKGR
ncbi:MAG: c-type cytochrome [Parachlamydiaceae bacterium]